MNPTSREDEKKSPQAANPGSAEVTAEDKRVDARRRFLKMGGGGSAAVMVTVMHRRAFAGIKKGTVLSNCLSINGIPDMKGMKNKKALELSPMGTPKGLQCRPRNEVIKAGDQCKALPDKKDSEFFAHKDSPNQVRDVDGFYRDVFHFDVDNDKNGKLYSKVKYWDDNVNKGCGSLQETTAKSYGYRLYQKGWCPVKYDSNGLSYDTSAKYFEQCTDLKDGVPKDLACTFKDEKAKDDKPIFFKEVSCFIPPGP